MGMRSGRPFIKPRRNLHHNHNSNFHLICTSNSGDTERLSQTYNTISRCSAQDFKTSRVSHCAALPQQSSWQTTTPLRHTLHPLPRTPGTNPSLSPPTIHFSQLSAQPHLAQDGCQIRASKSTSILAALPQVQIDRRGPLAEDVVKALPWQKGPKQTKDLIKSVEDRTK